ncbi:hypothetical protein EVAR_45898_1 [Eumeta japonica]|uniref:Uncharacterized protein n=1 Tax=Eumeta variegata TaxID=151549 RepID=A0A4C1XUT6_EUMVA|nr:hypothetical protein EVAR_45898_1 [Eumeta japonica]
MDAGDLRDAGYGQIFELILLRKYANAEIHPPNNVRERVVTRPRPLKEWTQRRPDMTEYNIGKTDLQYTDGLPPSKSPYAPHRAGSSSTSAPRAPHRHSREPPAPADSRATSNDGAVSSCSFCGIGHLT